MSVHRTAAQAMPVRSSTRARAGSDWQSPSRAVDHSQGEAAPYFEPDTVVSRDALGLPVSYYRDLSWDLSAQSAAGESSQRLHFYSSETSSNPELVGVIREQQKALLWRHIDGANRAAKTIRQSNNAALQWCEKAHRRGIDLFAIMTTPEHVADEIESLNQTYLRHSCSLIKDLWLARSDWHLDVPYQRLRQRILEENDTRPEYRQTPLIPSRIYAQILGGLLAVLPEIDAGLDAVLDAFQRSVRVSRGVGEHGASKLPARFRARELAPVVQIVRRFGYEPDRGRSLQSFLEGLVNRLQSILLHVVIALTGMRHGEASSLPAEGVLETFEHLDATHFVIKGWTTKLNGGVRCRTSWITTRETHHAVRLAARISDAIHAAFGGQPAPGQARLLFCSTESAFRAKATNTRRFSQEWLIERLCPVLTQADFDELNEMQMERPWYRDDIEVGKRWPLKCHQLRRSLAVYAHRSGIVSLPSLKGQLQHITREMTLYYTDGFCRAANLVFEKEHFSHEWGAARAESTLLGFTVGLLFSDDDLLGRGASRVAETVRRTSRQETLKLLRNGKICYQETVLGGCTSTDGCTASPFQPIPFDCVNSDCVNLVIKPRRLDLAIKSQQAIVARLEGDAPGSVECRIEADNLQALLKARARVGGVAG